MKQQKNICADSLSAKNNNFQRKNDQRLDINELIKHIKQEPQQSQSSFDPQFAKFNVISQYPFCHINNSSQIFIQLSKELKQNQQEQSYEETNQTKKGLIKQLNNLKCLYNDKSFAQFMCINLLCQKYPLICQDSLKQSKQNNQCLCRKDHFNCKTIKSLTIINQLILKIQKPIRKQYKNYWLLKRQLYKWMINQRMSQQRQIIYKKYQEIKQMSLKLKNNNELKQDWLNNINNLYIYSSCNKPNQTKDFQTNYFPHISCYQKKVIQQSDKQKYHLSCNCKKQIINFKLYLKTNQPKGKVQQSCYKILKQLRITLSQYNKLFKYFQCIEQKLQYSLIMINMNPFQRLIFQTLTNSHSNFNSLNTLQKDADMLFNGHIIYRAKQYKNSYFHQKNFIQQTSLNKLKNLWQLSIQPYFYRAIEGKVCQKMAKQIKIAQEKKQEQQIYFEIIFKRLEFLENDMNINQRYLVPNCLWANERRKQKKNVKLIKIAQQYMKKLTTKNEFQIYYTEMYNENFNFLKQQNSYSDIFKNHKLINTRQNENINKDLTQNKLQIFYDIQEGFSDIPSFLAEKMKHYYPPGVQLKQKLNKFNFILQNFEKIYNFQLLQINQDELVSQQKITKLVKLIKNLKSLELSTVEKIYPKILSKHQYSFKKIKKLDISHYLPQKQQIQKQEAFSQEMKSQLYKKIQQMQILQLDINIQNIDSQLIKIIKKQNNILSLKIGSKLNSFQIFQPNFLNLKNLKELYIHESIQAFFDSNIFSEMKRLQNFYVYSYNNLYKIPNFQKISQLINLKGLVLHFIQKQKYINNQIIPYIIKLKNLQYIRMSYSSITSSEIKKLACLQKLKFLTFNNCKFKASDLIYLVNYLKNLQSLEIPLKMIKQQINESDLIQKQQTQLKTQEVKTEDYYIQMSQQELIEINDNVKTLQLFVPSQERVYGIYSSEKIKKVSKNDIGQLKYFKLLSRLSILKLGYQYFYRHQWQSNPKKQINRLNKQKNQLAQQNLQIENNN